ncbi:MAG: 16S rRNA (cytosine(967)-C(5))-methyltransferase RsmB, partial [Clostridia bacterium]|nr:16S rRNA (cytosine(967)-C(5))-methyltransferase RsmB [Clostridia bacterium]
MNTPRFLAFQSLLRCESGSRYSNLEINAVLDKNPLSQSDKGLYTALVYSVLEREMLLDYLLKDYLKMPIERLDREVRVALRLGAVQLYFFDKLPDHAVCDETVELIKNSKKRSATGLVNAVLRSLVRDKDKNTEKIANAPLNVRYSMPEWIVDLWTKDYGEERALAILEGFSKKPPLTLRVNTLKITPEELYRAFKDKNIQCDVK